MMATSRYTETAIQSCVFTAFSEVPKKRWIRRCLLDPLEEQLHLPTLPIQRADDQRRQAEVVGQKHQPLAGLVLEADAPQMFRVTVAGVKAVERDGLIAEHIGIALGRRRVEPSGIEIRLRLDDEKRACLVQGIEASEVGVPPVHHVEGAGFGDQEVEHIDFVQRAVRNVDKARNTAPQIEQRVHPDRRLGRTEVRPGKHRQAQIDWWWHPARRPCSRGPRPKHPQRRASLPARSGAGRTRHTCASRAIRWHRRGWSG